MSKKHEINLPNSEWQIMEQLWADAPKTVTQIVKAMEKETGWTKSTTKTLIARMEGKGYIRFIEGGKARLYFPAIDRADVVRSETESFLGRMFGGSLSLMMSAFVDRHELSREEIDKLRTILDRTEGGNTDA